VNAPKIRAFDVPVLGRVTAGAPILAVENIEEYFPVPKDFVDHEDVFILRIKGDSMVEAGILNGDYVLVSQQETAANGEIVVA
ncbi:MAG TPA: repressor LexA, partial [Firmicutes bacterium]|nr:repressor LexA [Bacillota bacterium]